MLTRIPIARAVRSTCKLERRTLLSIGRRQSKVGRMTRAKKKKVGRRTKRTSMCDLPADLVGQEILSRVPITSLRAVRSTCKLWNKLWDALSKEWVLCKASARDLFLGFMIKDSKVCSVRYHLCRNKEKEDKDLLDIDDDLVDVSIKQVDLLNQDEVSRVFHCDGLLLCVAKDKSRLVVWNPYLGQTKWIGLGKDFHIEDWYGLGYDINRSHKILRFWNYFERRVKRYEIYEFSSNSWRVLYVNSDWMPYFEQDGISVKGNTYFFAQNSSIEYTKPGEGIKDFLLCFDFTTERFGPPLHIPFLSYSQSKDIVALSCVREDKLALLHQDESVYQNRHSIVQIWVTTTIEPNYVSWSKFLRVEMKPNLRTGILFHNYQRCSFFIDEEKKAIVVFGIGGCKHMKTNKGRYNTAFIIGEDGYFRSVSATSQSPSLNQGYMKVIYGPPFACSSFYRPSLVQVNQPPQQKK